LVIIFRFSHTGKVCSGDFAEIMGSGTIDGQPQDIDSVYNKFFMREEGDFFYYYVMAWGIFYIIFIILACCVGGVMFGFGNFFSV